MKQSSCYLNLHLNTIVQFFLVYLILLFKGALPSSYFCCLLRPLFLSWKYYTKHHNMIFKINYCNDFNCYSKVGMAWFQLRKYFWNFRLQMEISCKVISISSLEKCQKYLEGYQAILVKTEKNNLFKDDYQGVFMYNCADCFCQKHFFLFPFRHWTIYITLSYVTLIMYSK